MERKALSKRLAILRAAASAFRDRGLAQTGMREIADAADLSPANLYYYFASKDELLYFCQDHSVDRLLEQSRAIAASDAAPDVKLARVIEAHLRCVLDELDGAAAHLEVDSLPPDLRARIVAKRDRYERAVRAIVADGLARGTFVDCDPTLIGRAILGALNWTARWYRPEGKQSASAVATAFADYLVRGLLPWKKFTYASASTAKTRRSASPRTRRSSRSSART
jgi:AcrR family transcriptional regulator